MQDWPGGKANPAKSFKMVKGRTKFEFRSLKGRRDECLRTVNDFTYNERDREMVVSRGIGHSTSGFTPAFVYFRRSGQIDSFA